MQSPMLMQPTILSHPYQPDQVQSVHAPIAYYRVPLCTAIPSSFDTFRALTNFPSEETSLFHTHASYSKQHISELVDNPCGNWTLTLKVPIPDDIIHPTLTSFTHTVKYSTANHHGAAVVQSNILLAVAGSEAIPTGVSADLGTFEGTATMCLSSLQGVKQNTAQGQWSHFIDFQEVPLNVRIIQSSCLYMQLHISEYPTAKMLRSLSVDVSATWLEDQEGRRLANRLREAELLAADIEAKAAAEEAARKTAEAQVAADEKEKEKAEANQHAAEAQSVADTEARKAAAEEAIKASSERQAAEASVKEARIARASSEANAEKARLARQHADHDYEVEHEKRIKAETKAEVEGHAREEAERKLREAQAVADHTAKLKAEAEKRAKAKAEAERHAKEDEEALRKIKHILPGLSTERRCHSDHGWVREAGGYRCMSGKHHITWAELKEEDEKEQERIRRALHHLPVGRRCTNGLPWIREPDGGYRCAGRSHHITLEELSAADEKGLLGHMWERAGVAGKYVIEHTPLLHVHVR